MDNLDSIVENGLLPRKNVRENGIGFKDIADPEIIDKRKLLGLDKYTPFHFHPYTAFDYAVKYKGDAEHMIYICIDRDFARDNNFLVLPKHPLSSNDFELFPFDEGMSKIDWATMMVVGRDDQYAKEVKMAESLTGIVIPANKFKCLYVANEEMKQFVSDKFKEHGIGLPPPYVNIMAKWFDDYDSVF